MDIPSDRIILLQKRVKPPPAWRRVSLRRPSAGYRGALQPVPAAPEMVELSMSA